MVPRLPSSLLAACASAAAFSPSPKTATPRSRELRQDVSARPPTLRMSLPSLDDSNMDDLLLRPPGGRAVLVDAHAPWCGPCRLIEPYLDGCADKYSDRLSVLKYDVEGDNNKNLKVEMGLQGVLVRGLPTLVLYHRGRPLATHSGIITETGLEKWLEDNLSSVKDEFEAEVRQQSATTNSGKTEEPDEAEDSDAGAAGKTRGFVSFASQFGQDDYMLSG